MVEMAKSLSNAFMANSQYRPRSVLCFSACVVVLRAHVFGCFKVETQRKLARGGPLFREEPISGGDAHGEPGGFQLEPSSLGLSQHGQPRLSITKESRRSGRLMGSGPGSSSNTCPTLAQSHSISRPAWPASYGGIGSGSPGTPRCRRPSPSRASLCGRSRTTPGKFVPLG